jgi:hypothetical protein
MCNHKLPKDVDLVKIHSESQLNMLLQRDMMIYSNRNTALEQLARNKNLRSRLLKIVNSFSAHYSL